MPTYDYVCEACDHAFELFQSIKEEAKRKCPECGRQKLRRLIGPGRGHRVQGLGLLQDRLSQRVLQEGGLGGEEQSSPPQFRRCEERRWCEESDSAKGKDKKANK